MTISQIQKIDLYAYRNAVKLHKYNSKGLFKVNRPNNFLQMHFCRRLPLAYKADSQVLPQKLQILHPSHLLAPITWKWLFKACDQVMTNCNFLALQSLFWQVRRKDLIQFKSQDIMEQNGNSSFVKYNASCIWLFSAERKVSQTVSLFLGCFAATPISWFCTDQLQTTQSLLRALWEDKEGSAGNGEINSLLHLVTSLLQIPLSFIFHILSFICYLFLGKAGWKWRD